MASRASIGSPAEAEEHREAGARTAVDAHVAVREQSRVRVAQHFERPGDDALESLDRDDLTAVVDAVPAVADTVDGLPDRGVVPLLTQVQNVRDAARHEVGNLSSNEAVVVRI